MLWECSPALELTLILGFFFFVYKVAKIFNKIVKNLHSSSEIPHVTY